MPAGSSDSSRNAGTWLALFGLLLVGFGLLALVAMALPQAFGLLSVIGGFSVMAVLQYLVWGDWLSNRRPPEFDDSDGRSAGTESVERSE